MKNYTVVLLACMLISSSTTQLLPAQEDIIIDFDGTYTILAQPQVEKTSGGGTASFHMWARIGSDDKGTTTSVSVANPSVIATTDPHGLTTGQTVEISNTTTTPDINGQHVITVTGARVAFFSKSNADASELSAIAASLVNSGKLAVDRLEFNTLTDVMVRGLGGFVILRSLGRFVLVGGTKNIKAFTKAAGVLVTHSQKLIDILAEIPDEQY